MQPDPLHRRTTRVPATTAPPSLTAATLKQGVRELAARDAGLAAIVARHGHPPMWGRARGFATLVRIILEQQVSLASAAAMFAKVERELGGVTPVTVRAAGDGCVDGAAAAAAADDHPRGRRGVVCQ